MYDDVVIGLKNFHLYRNQISGEYRVSVNYYYHPYLYTGTYIICHGPISIEQYRHGKLLEEQ